MAYLNIVSWNVRNLSQTMDRKGVRGHGLCLDYRLKNVLNNLENMKPHIAFLMETGPDGQYVANFIRSRSVYGAMSSPVTQGESYVIIFRPELYSGFQASALIGNDNNYRKGWMVSFGIERTAINFAVLHAPSPAASINDRILQIRQVAQNAIDNSDGLPLLFMGDLNIQQKDLDKLGMMMTELQLKHLGQFEEANSNNNNDDSDNDNDNDMVPALTSFRKFTTMLKNNQNLKKGSVDSQPYDQFWGNALLSSLQANVASINVNGPATNKFVAWLTTALQEVFDKNCIPDHKDLRGRKTVTRVEELFVSYDSFLTAISGLSTFNNKWFRDLYKLPVDKWVRTLMLIENFVGNIMKMDSLRLSNNDNANPSLDLGIGQYNKIKVILTNANAVVPLMVSACQMKTSGIQGLQDWTKTIFEFAVSDHKPIGISVSFSDGVYDQIIKQSKRQVELNSKNNNNETEFKNDK